MMLDFSIVPQHWTRAPLKRYLHVQSGEMITADRETVTGFPIYGGNGVRGYTDEYNTDAPRLVIGRVGAKCGCVHLAEENFWASEHAFVVYPRRDFSLVYGKYLISAIDLNALAIRTAQPLINTEIVENAPAAFPPISEQERIAQFLDRETERLDQLIVQKQRLLGLLSEKRRVIIADFLTRGLNKDAPRRDSGIPWVGEIPAHWQIERAKWLFTERDDRSDSGDEELLTVSHLTGVTSRAEKDVNMFMAESLEGYKRCEAGDLVINTLWAWMGGMGVARQPGIVSPAYNVYQPVVQLDPEYVDLLVRTPRFVEEITRYSKGVWSSRLRLYPEGLYEAWLPVPPLDEQQAIVKHVQIETKKLDSLAEATERTISLLQERRSALISAAVTGQIEIGEAIV